VAILWADSGARGKPDGRFDPHDLVLAADGAPIQLVPLLEVVPEPFRLLRFRDFTFLQSHLRHLDLYRGKNTGAFDASTQAALIRFQQEQGLPRTGLPDQPTLVALLRAVRDRIRE
jgi:hypothetical protein